MLRRTTAACRRGPLPAAKKPLETLAIGWQKPADFAILAA